MLLGWKRKGDGINGIQEVDWSYDVDPWYEGEGLDELCELKTDMGAEMSRIGGGLASTGVTEASTNSTSRWKANKPNKSANSNRPLFKIIYQDKS